MTCEDATRSAEIRAMISVDEGMRRVEEGMRRVEKSMIRDAEDMRRV